MALAPLAALRLRLTAWYVLTLGVILVLLGGRLLVVVRAELARQLDASLEDGTVELMRAARVSDPAPSGSGARSFAAVDRLRIPERTLYLLTPEGRPMLPDTAADWIRDAARVAARESAADTAYAGPSGSRLRAHAERFTLEGGEGLVAVVVADEAELREQYKTLLAAFSGAALLALVLVAGGGFLISRKFTAPIERNIEYMRRFMADAAHELRTPIAVMRTSAEVTLQQDRASAEYQDVVRGVEREAERLGRMVEDMLVLARADAGERPIVRERVFLDDVVLDAAQAARTLATAKGVSLEVGQFEEATIDADATLVRQLVMNLLSNAVKFTPAGSRVNVDVATMAGVPTVVVEDSGSGIAPEHLPHVFERFYRADAARGRGEGAGLGLAIVKWIADVHGAEIRLTSTPGHGTRVEVRFQPAVQRAVSSS
jgi:signal transduction histidine kinase